ncbi:hypothetical protein PMAYCL1PPCAC_22559, partial [Pristionchus mayeri]
SLISFLFFFASSGCTRQFTFPVRHTFLSRFVVSRVIFPNFSSVSVVLFISASGTPLSQSTRFSLGTFLLSCRFSIAFVINPRSVCSGRLPSLHLGLWGKRLQNCSACSFQSAPLKSFDPLQSLRRSENATDVSRGMDRLTPFNSPSNSPLFSPCDSTEGIAPKKRRRRKN